MSATRQPLFLRLAAAALLALPAATAPARPLAEALPSARLAYAGALPAAQAIVTLAVNGAPYLGNISPAGDADWYQFTVAAGVYTVTTQAGTLTADLLYLYGPGSQTNLLQWSGSGGPGGMALISRTLAAGTYYVKILSQIDSATGTYTIRVSSSGAAPAVTSFAINNGAASTASSAVKLNNSCSGSPTAYEASESAAFGDAAWLTYATAPAFTLSAGFGAKAVYFKVKNAAGTESGVASDTIVAIPAALTLAINGAPYLGNISPAGDADWYVFTAAAGVYTITTQAGTLTGDLMLLYDSTLTNVVQTSSSGGPGGMAQLSRTLAAGTYYVKILALVESDAGTYNIRVATGNGAPVVSSFTINNGAASTTNRVVTLNNRCSGYPVAYQANAAANFAGADWLDYTNAPAFTLPLALGSCPRTVYFKVKNAAGTESAVVSHGITLNQPPLALSPNGPAVAGNINPAGDANLFAFTLAASATCTIGTQAGSLNDTIMYLYGPNSPTALLASDDDGGQGAMSEITRALSAGTNYVKIVAKPAGATGTFTISVSTTPTVAAFAIDNGAASTASSTVTLSNRCTGVPMAYMASESSAFGDGTWLPYSAAPVFTLSPVNGAKTVYFKVRNAAGTESAALSDTITLSGPTPVTLAVNGAPYLGSIAPAGDADWYVFIAPGGVCTITTQAGTLTGDVMSLYGPNGQTLLETSNTGAPGGMAQISRFLAAGTYYLRILPLDAADTGTYTIRVSSGGTAPSVGSLAINHGATTTTNVTVTLNNTCSGAPVACMASESAAFAGAGWQTYTNAPKFVLGEGNCTHTVYFKIRNAVGVESASASDTIVQSLPPVALAVNAEAVAGNIRPAADEDWFVFTAATATNYVIGTQAGTLAATGIYLYGPNSKTALLATDNSGPGDMSEIARSLAKGTYYVKVVAKPATATGNYTITVTSP